MNCKETRELLDGYFDGEVDLVRSLEVERHLEQCPDCSQALRQREMLRNGLRQPALYQRAPERLRERVRTIAPRSRISRFWLRPSWQLVAAAASVVLVLAGGWGLWRLLPGGRSHDLLAEAVIDSHVRSLLASHLVDVAGPDRHIVKPWFAHQLDFSPPVINLDQHGFTLEGGRVDYIDHRKVASIVYKRRQHLVNLLIWPAPPEAMGGETVLRQQGFNLIHWAKSGFSFWAISDLNEPELQTFTGLIRGQTD